MPWMLHVVDDQVLVVFVLPLTYPLSQVVRPFVDGPLTFSPPPAQRTH
jgi:hypothetical protein